VGRAAGLRILAGAARHTVAVLEPHPAFDVPRMPMVFDIGAGLYWRLEEGGLLFGWSDPDEQPGEARSIDWAAYDRARSRLAGFVPLTRELGLRRIWAATIDYTPDHLPIIGPALTPAGDRIDGVTVASAGGHGMMWGPGVARVAADPWRTAGPTWSTSRSVDRWCRGRSLRRSDRLPFPVAPNGGSGRSAAIIAGYLLTTANRPPHDPARPAGRTGVGKRRRRTGRGQPAGLWPGDDAVDPIAPLLVGVSSITSPTDSRWRDVRRRRARCRLQKLPRRALGVAQRSSRRCRSTPIRPPVEDARDCEDGCLVVKRLIAGAVLAASMTRIERIPLSAFSELDVRGAA
jgi:hypothetical protein